MEASFRVRPARPEDARPIAEVHVAVWRTTYRGLVPDSLLQDVDLAQREARWRHRLTDPGSWPTHVAERIDGRLVGFATGGLDRDGALPYASELGAIYILQAFQRQGIGRALVRRIVEDVTAQGARSMIVWVLADNPYRAFYESLGAHRVGRRQAAHGGRMLEEVAYGWEELARTFPAPESTG